MRIWYCMCACVCLFVWCCWMYEYILFIMCVYIWLTMSIIKLVLFTCKILIIWWYVLSYILSTSCVAFVGKSLSRFAFEGNQYGLIPTHKYRGEKRKRSSDVGSKTRTRGRWWLMSNALWIAKSYFLVLVLVLGRERE